MSLGLALLARTCRLRILLPAIIIVSFLVCFVIYPYRYNLHDTLSYSTRPSWDRPQGPQQAIAHLQAPKVPANDDAACQRHSWQLRNSTHLLWDATLISTELDMLEIRLRELWEIVDKFIILESTHSLTGNPKVCVCVCVVKQLLSSKR